MGKPNVDAPIEDSVIDETFKGLVSPSETHRLGREDITENRPGDVLVDAVARFSAKGGFARKDTTAASSDVNVKLANSKHVSLDVAEDIASRADLDSKTSDLAE